MDCGELDRGELAERYLTGQLDSSAQDEFEVHILECPKCLRAVEILQSVSDDLTQRAHGIRTDTSTGRLWLRWQWIAAGALSVLLCTVGILQFQFRASSKSGNDINAPMPSTIASQESPRGTLPPASLSVPTAPTPPRPVKAPATPSASSKPANIVVDNSGKSGTIQKSFASGESVALAKKDFVVVPPPPPPPPTLSPEEKDWIQVMDSVSIEELEKFRVRYPNSSSHHGEVEAKLDDLYWNQAKQANRAEEYTRYLNEHTEGAHREEAKAGIDSLAWNSAVDGNTVQAFLDYVRRDSQGAHAGEATKMIETLQFRTARSSEDEAVLEAFLSEYPSGPLHDQIYARLDDVAWAKTNKDDRASLRAYLQEFQKGIHTDQAQKQIEQLAAKTQPPSPVRPRSDDKQAVRDVLTQYQHAYEHKKIGEMKGIWPTMPPSAVSGLRKMFRDSKSIKMTCDIVDGPAVSGDQANIGFTQALTIDGRQQTTHVVMTLKRVASSPDGSKLWEIESVGK